MNRLNSIKCLIVPFVLIYLISLTGCQTTPSPTEHPLLRIATFDVDATPEIGSPVAYAPTRSITERLKVRGVVLLTDDQPIVLAAIDWIGIANKSYDVWRNQLAKAAGTTPDRVTIHALHQHDAPRDDRSTQQLLTENEIHIRMTDIPFVDDVIQRTSSAIQSGMANPHVITHLGLGEGQVEKVASNRRILGDDGKVKIVRYSKTKDPAAIAAPEGLIDPMLKCISFWQDDKPIASLTYYATHPQSYYGQGDVTSDFVGIARDTRDNELSGVLHVHFNGAGGNIAAGKYNDGSKPVRNILAKRTRDGMQRAWDNTKKVPIIADDIKWRTTNVQLPLGEHLDQTQLEAEVANRKINPVLRARSAAILSWVQRSNTNHPVTVSCLELGNHASLLHLPGELFVEYQLAAQKMAQDRMVCMAAYGQYGPGYIGTAISYTQGGYETGPTASLVSPKVEKILLDALKKVLKTD